MNDLCNMWYSPTATDEVVTGMLVYVNLWFTGLPQSVIHIEQKEWNFGFQCIMIFSYLINFSFYVFHCSAVTTNHTCVPEHTSTVWCNFTYTTAIFSFLKET